MKYSEDLPQRGIIEAIVHFEGYQGNFQNDTRRTLNGKGRGKTLPGLLDEKLGGKVEIEPKDFKLLRKVIGGAGRAVGGSHTYRYETENAEDTHELMEAMKDSLKELTERRDGWRSFDLYFLEKIKIRRRRG